MHSEPKTVAEAILRAKQWMRDNYNYRDITLGCSLKCSECFRKVLCRGRSEVLAMKTETK